MNRFVVAAAALASLVVAPLARAESVSVAVAISLKDAMADIAAAYEKEAGDEVEFTFASSGQLMAQIRNGAPIDAFISAANKQVDELIEGGELDKATRCEIAGNKLVLIVPGGDAVGEGGPASFEDLKDARHRKVAIGEPKTVPAGQYAMQTLTKLGAAESLRESGRLVYGANVRQVLDYVVRGEVAAGIVYATDAKEAGGAVRVVATADEKSHDPIVYPSAVVKASRNAKAAERFLMFLQGAEARAILKERGFTIPREVAEAEKESEEDASDGKEAERSPAPKPEPREPAGR